MRILLSLANGELFSYSCFSQPRLLRVFSCFLLLSSAWLCLYLPWQHYQRLLSDTENLLQQIANLPAVATSLPDTKPSVLGSMLISPSLTQLIQQINQQITQHDLRLLALHQPATVDWEESSGVQLQANIVGNYPELLAFLKAWGMQHSTTKIQEISLRRSTAASDLILSLSLLVPEAKKGALR